MCHARSHSAGSGQAALANIQEAVAGYLESLRKHGDPIPPPITEEVIEVEP